MRPALRTLPVPLDQPGVRVFSRARQALARCLPALGLRPGDAVLVPTHHHGSEVEAFRQVGVRCVPYEPGPDLQPDEAELDRLVTPRTRALHLIHHLGFPQDGQRWRRWCDSRELLLVEDAAQAWLSERDGTPVGSYGHLAVFCLSKSVGLPDGVAACSSSVLPHPETRGATGWRRLVTPAARAVLELVGPPPAPRAHDHASDIAVPQRSSSRSALTRWLLPRAGLRTAAGRRRAADARLLEGLGPLVPPAFAALPPGASPFVFPVAVADKAAALTALRARGVVALDLWRTAHPLVPGRPDGTAAALRQHVLGLPVHPALGAADVDRVLAAASDLLPAGVSAGRWSGWSG